MRFDSMKKRIAEVVITALLVVLSVSLTIGQEAIELTSGDPGMSPGRLKYSGAPGTRDLILQDYAEKTGRTLLLDPKLPQANIVLRSQTELNLTEYLEAIERALRMHGIQLVPVGEKFLKVVPVVGRPIQEGLEIRESADGAPLPETGKLVSQMVTLKHIDIPEAQKVILPFKHDYGVVHGLERSNSLLITDTAAVVNRMMQVLKNIDQPIVAREEPNVVQVRFAKATAIKAKLEEIIKESQAEEKRRASVISTSKKSGSPGVKRTTIPGVIRPQVTTASDEPEVIALEEELAEKGVIRGKVQITADDRTNVLIIITRPENMKFFNRIIQVLDVETAPDVVVRIFRLEFADADNVAKMLNNLIGMSKGKDEVVGAGKKAGDGPASAALKDYVAKQGESSGDAGASKVGELSSQNIKILADKRTNALIVMASESDIRTLTAIIDDMDMMLSQVLIEAVILDVELDDVVQTGMDWVQRAMIAYDDRAGPKEALFGFAGGAGGGTLAPLNTIALNTASAVNSAMPTGHGLSYYFTHFGLNLDVILNMSANDTRTQIISSPVIVTHDNTEAKIESSVERYFFKGKRWVSTGTSSGTYEDDVESRKVSLTLTVTPHINTNKLVVMDIVQQIQELGASQLIGDTEWPTMNTREMKASISVTDKETIVLGGLVRKGSTKTNKGVPFLRKIPLLGTLFRSKSDSERKSEIVVFITPYVLNDGDDIRAETERRKDSLDGAGELWEKGWSDSKMAKPTREQEREEEKKELERKKKAYEQELREVREREEIRKLEEAAARLKAEEEARELAHQQRLKEIQEEAAAKIKAEMAAKRREKEERERLEAEEKARKEAQEKAEIEAKRREKEERERLEREEEARKAAEKEAREKAELEEKRRKQEERERAEREERERKEAEEKAEADRKAKAEADEKARKLAEEEARKRAEESDPLHDLDPDLVDYIKEREKRWEKNIDKIDQFVEEKALDLE